MTEDVDLGLKRQETRHYHFKNHGEIFDGYCRGGYMSYNRPYNSLNTGELGILLDFSVLSHERSVHRSQTTHLT